MSRIVDKPYFTYSAYNALTSGIQVKCPKCHGAGVVTADEDIRDKLDGCLFSVLFNQQGRAFAGYYYGEGDSPYYPADVDDNALRFFGPERYHSNEFQDEAYLFIPFDEDYYQAMAKVIEERFENWQGQDFDEDTLEPSEVAHAIMEYLDCECTYFPSMADDDPIMSAYSYAQRLGVREGFVPVLIQADDETLLECLVMNADPEHDADFYEFDLKTVEEYRKKVLSAPIKDGKAVLEELIGQRKEEAEDDDMDWEEEVLSEMESGYDNNRFSCYWNSDTDMTHPLILAKIPVKNPWEIFAYLPFGNWNECPDTPNLMADITGNMLKEKEADILTILADLPDAQTMIGWMKKVHGLTTMQELTIDEALKTTTQRLSPYVRQRLTFMRLLKFYDFYDEITEG